jgi:hypothetical protein
MFLDVVEQRRNGKDKLAVLPFDLTSQTCQHLPKITGEQIVFVLIMRVKCRTAYVSPIANVLHGDGRVALFLNQADQRVRQGLARALCASIGWSVFGQMRRFVH